LVRRTELEARIWDDIVLRKIMICFVDFVLYI
jgi:hypothetical protein